MEGYQWGGGEEGGEWRKKLHGIRSMVGRYKIDRGRLRIVGEMEKTKNLYLCFTDTEQTFQKFIWNHKQP